MTGVHGLEHVERFFGTDLADDDAVGTHAQGVDEKFALLDPASSLDVGGAAFESHNVMLSELKFGRVFDGDDAFGVRDEAGEHVEQRCFAGARAAGDDDIEACFDGALQKLQHLGSDGEVTEKICGLKGRGAETADGDDGAIHCKRRNDDVDARTVGETSVDHRR